MKIRSKGKAPINYYTNGYNSFDEFSDIHHANTKIHVKFIGDEELISDRNENRKQCHLLLQNKMIIDGYDYLEFGTYEGWGARLWIDKVKQVYGFDSFTGLPDQWVRGFNIEAIDKHYWTVGEIGEYSGNGKVPQVDGIIFIEGLFQDTLYDFLKTYKNTNKIIHIDSDLFSSALFILTTIHPYLLNDDIIIFDEFPDRLNEFAAFNYYLMSYYMKDKLELIVYGHEVYIFKIKDVK